MEAKLVSSSNFQRGAVEGIEAQSKDSYFLLRDEEDTPTEGSVCNW